MNRKKPPTNASADLRVSSAISCASPIMSRWRPRQKARRENQRGHLSKPRPDLVAGHRPESPRAGRAPRMRRRGSAAACAGTLLWLKLAIVAKASGTSASPWPSERTSARTRARLVATAEPARIPTGLLLPGSPPWAAGRAAVVGGPGSTQGERIRGATWESQYPRWDCAGCPL